MGDNIGVTDLTAQLIKVRLEVNALKNTASRALYAVDQAIEIAGRVPAPPVIDPYAGGLSYPPAATVNVGSVEVPPGATVVHVPVTLSRESPNTVIAFVRCYNGTGGRANPDTTKAVHFRSGDPLTKTVSFAISNMTAGSTVLLAQANEPDGAVRGGTGSVRAVAGAVNVALPAGRAPAAFTPLGSLIYNETGRGCVEGGLWLDRLAHGRTQVGNGETGYYHPDAVTVSGDDLVLRSYRLPAPVRVGSPAVEYPFAASMLSGLREVGGNTLIRPELVFKHGSIEWEAKMPNRRGSWPALWLLGYKDNWPQWPPEIDVFEGFYYTGDFLPGQHLSNNLHGGPNGSRTWTRGAIKHRMSDHGLVNTLDTAFHKFACTVDAAWITMFVDGIETFRYANPFESADGWYPLMNVAVKALPNSAYDQGSGDMTVRRVKIWRV